ncbi:Ig-like domain-containing protein [Citrobacter amalonaticus]|uniref:Ig-like domain-containing protein n=1 Tax=Citrobacter amalonaticus TaxID=35703 RepID=UPI00300C2310
MSDTLSAGSSLIFYTGKNYAGNAQQIAHGVTGELAGSSATWDYLSVALSAMDAYVFSAVNTADTSMNYLGHVETVISVSQADLTLLYPSSDQFPLNYLGLDPAQAAVVWLDVDATQAAPNAVASTALVGGGSSSITTLSLPGRPGALGFVAKTEGSSVVASCRYGDYNTANGTVTWSGTGTLILEYTGGIVTLINGGGFPAGWTFSAPKLQGDGSWAVTLNGGVPASDTISSVTANPGSIVDDGVSSSVITATVLNGSGQPASGVTVTWSTSLGAVAPASSVTDTNGLATTTLTDSGAPGTATVTASITGSSKSVDVSVSAGSSGHIKVMGARKSQSYFYHRATPDSLVALDTVTLQPVECHWRYDGEVKTHRGSRFTDFSPQKLLTVTPVNGGISRVLNVSNIVGNGADDQTASSFAAMTNGGLATSWGYAGTGGIPPISLQNHNLRMMATRIDAMLALNDSGQIFEWGGSMYGNTIPPEIESLSDITYIEGGEYHFTALRSTGQVVAWGNNGSETLPPEIQSLTDLVQTISNEGATAALRANGQIVAWGNSGSGGVVPDYIAALGDIVSVVAGTRSFAALRAGGQVVAWGSADEGGLVPAQIAALNDIVHVTAGDYVYTALRAGGQIVAWGDGGSGGSVPADISALTDIVSSCANWVSCAALRANGQVVAWGDSSGGGTVPADVAALTDIVALTESERAYAALRSNGEVVAWGDIAYGGRIPADTAALLTGVVAVYSAYQAFCALKDNDTVIVWGSGQAGDMNEIPLNLQGAITYSYELK